MNNNSISIGVIIGLLIFFLGWISKSDVFNKTQKVIIFILSILFFPGGILLSIILYLFNQYKRKNKINSNETLEYKLNLLKESYNSGIINEAEYTSKKNTLFTSNDNSAKLIELYKIGLLTKDEFETKVNGIEYKTNFQLKSKQTLSIIILSIILIATIICLIFVIQNYQNNEIYNTTEPIDSYNYDANSIENKEIKNNFEYTNETNKNEVKVEPTIFVFYSSYVDDGNKPIVIKPEYSIYEQKTVCTKIYEIRDVDFYQFDERIKDYMLSIFNINSTTVYKFKDYKQTYDKKSKLSEGVIETGLFDVKFSEYSN